MNTLQLDSGHRSRSLRSRGARGGYVMLIAMILMAVLAVIGATSLSIAGEILARICTKILREIRADFLRGSAIKRIPTTWVHGRRLPLYT